MNKMHHSSHGLRIALLAGASVVALVAATPSAGAADLSKPTLTKAPPPAPAPRERWAWWIEGGAFNPSGDAFSLGARVSNIRPKWGWEAAAGFDWMPGWGQWHLSGQFRYGSAQKTQAFKAGFGAPSTTIITPAGGTTLVVAKSNNEKIRDDHWLVDFAVGRDFGLGNSNAQWKIGLRVADLRARLTATGTVATTGATVGPFNTQQNATAVLVGERHTSQTTFPTPIGGGVFAPI